MADKDVPGVVAPPPLVYLGALAVGFGLEAVLPSASIPGALRWLLGAALLLAGVGLLASFVGAFRRARTPVPPYEPTTSIVTGGPYRLSRNPGYLGMTLAYSGIALLGGALWPFLTLGLALIVIDRGVIRREERYLERRFGDEYLRYRGQTRRWI